MAGISTRTWAQRQNQFEGWSPGKPTADDLTTEKEENKLTYINKSKFSVHDKIKLQTRGFDTAERYAAAQKQLSLERGTAEIEETAFDAAFDEIIETVLTCVTRTCGPYQKRLRNHVRSAGHEAVLGFYGDS